MSNPKRVAAGRKGGQAKYKGKKGFAATGKAQAAGRKGALKRWRRPKPPAPTGPSALSKHKLYYEASPNEPKLTRKRKTTK